jgi:arginase
MRRQYHVIGACSCWGAQIRACEKGPEDLVEGQVFKRLQDQGISIREVEMLYPDKLARKENIPLPKSLSLIQNFNLQMVKAVRKALKNGSFPIVVGGDHSIAVGTWNAFEVPFGLIWIDAHLDSHTDKTTPSGAYHGMPLAALLGAGLPEMARLIKKEPVLKPKNVAIIGARSFEPGELNFLKELNVRIYFEGELEERGLKEILPEAISYVTREVDHYGVSLDLDVFAVDEAPGVGSPEPGGIRKSEFLPLLPLFGKDPRLLAFELVEFNPERDIEHKTRELAFEVLKQVMG